MIDVRYLRWLRRLSVVPRWSVVPVLRRQNVAEHSFHVASLSMWLVSLHAKANDKEFELKVLKYALTHDIEEAGEGDAPSPSRGKTEANGDDQVKVVVKCADILESLLFVYEESLLGNAMGMEAIIDHRYNEFVDWWRYFEIEGRAIHSTEVVMSAKSVAFSKNYPHPAIEGLPPCLPIK